MQLERLRGIVGIIGGVCELGHRRGKEGWVLLQVCISLVFL